MKKELDYFMIGNSYGGNQDWHLDPVMRFAGCGALTACDSCIYFAKYLSMKSLYPYTTGKIEKKDYVRFSRQMKSFLRPGRRGIHKLELFVDGMGRYLEVCGVNNLKMQTLSGHVPVSQAHKAIKNQINSGYPVPCLLLKHKNLSLDDFAWHWFLLTGYIEAEDVFLVKTATYGEYHWLLLEDLWDTGYEERGGLILYERLRN